MANVIKINPYEKLADDFETGMTYFISNVPPPGGGYTLKDIPQYIGAYIDTLQYNASIYPPITAINSIGISSIALTAFYDFNNLTTYNDCENGNES